MNSWLASGTPPGALLQPVADTPHRMDKPVCPAARYTQPRQLIGDKVSLAKNILLERRIRQVFTRSQPWPSIQTARSDGGNASWAWRAWVCTVLLAFGGACMAQSVSSSQQRAVEIVGAATLFAPGNASTQFADVRLTLSPDGQTALWFTRNRPGGPGGYDIWMSRRGLQGWNPATPVPFNSAQRDFDPAFSSDGRYVYFCSDRPGGFGGDDIYRVGVTSEGFGRTEHLGEQVNSPGNEWAPMLAPDQTRLLFASDGRGGAGRFDLFAARRENAGFAPAMPLPGNINTPANEFDATFLADSSTIVFAQASDFKVDSVNLLYSSLHSGRYDAGTLLPQSVNASDQDTYGPMLDWSRPDHITFSGHRVQTNAGGTDLYLIAYRLVRKRAP